MAQKRCGQWCPAIRRDQVDVASESAPRPMRPGVVDSRSGSVSLVRQGAPGRLSFLSVLHRPADGLDICSRRRGAEGGVRPLLRPGGVHSGLGSSGSRGRTGPHPPVSREPPAELERSASHSSTRRSRWRRRSARPRSRLGERCSTAESRGRNSAISAASTISGRQSSSVSRRVRQPRRESAI